LSAELRNADTTLLLHPVMLAPSEIVDPSLDSLSEEARKALVTHWLRRSQSEWRVGLAFEALEVLGRGMADDVVLRLLHQSAGQELEHARLCHRLAERYAGSNLPQVMRPDARLPDFGTESARLELTFNIVGLCCINETFATAWLRYCLALARTPLAVAANREHLKDEIDHARLGWAHLASSWVTREDKLALAERLPELIRVNLALWEAASNYLPGDALPEQGQPSSRESRRVLRQAVDELLLPGFAYVGVTGL
jgi:hypothetical protein